MRQQAAKQILKELIAWQFRLEAEGLTTEAKDHHLYVKEQQSLLDELMDQVESQYDLSDYADEEWISKKKAHEESLIEAKRHAKIRFQAKVADQLGFRYLSVIETDEPTWVDGQPHVSMSCFPHVEPEEMEAFKDKYIQEPCQCYRLNLRVPQVRNHLGLESVRLTEERM